MAMNLNYDAATFVERANIGDTAAVKLFLRAGISVDKTPFNETAIVAAAEEGHLETVKVLAGAGANVDRALVAAGGGKNKAVLDFLLTRNPKKESIAGALYVAAGQGNHIEFVRDLLDRGVDVNSEWSGTPLMSAAYYGNLDILKLLLERGANVKAVDRGEGGRGETALHYATRGESSRIQIVETLLGSGAPVNAQDRDGRTPLMNGLDSRELTQLLLAHDADVKLREKDGVTVLHLAAGEDLTWLIKPVIDRGAVINARNDRGETPLMWATGAIDSVDRPEMTQVLIDYGADVNLADQDGNTALMFAAQKGLAGSIRTLLRNHAQAAARNKEGQTALDIAEERGRKAIVKLLSETH